MPSGTALLVEDDPAVARLRDADGTPCGYLDIDTDLTILRRVDEQRRHSQKLESIGLLAGGVAHDLNNLLTVINGYSEMVLSEMPADSPFREFLREISTAGDRAAGLTQQLLTFSRKQLVQSTVSNTGCTSPKSGKWNQVTV
jgi:two-component system cell cycle sensor histidine kinase/response regulator CckA